MSDLLQFVWYKDFDNWSVKSYLNSNLLHSQFELVLLGKLITPRQEKVKKEDYRNDIELVKKISFKDGIIHLRDEKQTKTDLYKIYPNDFLISKLNFHQKALALNNYEQLLLSTTDYQPYTINNSILDSKYLVLVLRGHYFQENLRNINSEGVKPRAKPEFIKTLKIPLPSLKIQQKLVKNYQDKLNLAKAQNQLAKQKEAEIETYLYSELGIELSKEESQENKPLLQFVRFKDLTKWDVKNLLKNTTFSSKYNLIKLDKCCNHFKNGVNFNKSQFGNGVKFVNIKDVYTEKYVDLETLNRIEISQDKTEQNLLQDNDLVFVRSSVKYEGVGFPSLIKLSNENDKVVFCGFVIKCSIDTSLIIPDYLLYFLRCDLLRKATIEKSNKSTITNISQPELKSLQIPLPPLKIQTKIANYIQTIKDEIKRLKQQAEQNQKDALNEFEKEVFNAS